MTAAALAVLAAVAAAPVPPAPTHRVEDHAGFLTPATRDMLDGKLAAYERATGHQVVVWIGTTLGGAPLDDWAVRTFAAWKVGRAKLDDGLVIFVLANDRAIDIEVGYGLEDKVPDAIASRIIHDTMIPKLRAGDRDAALIAGTDAVLAAIEGKPWADTGTPPGTKPAPTSPYEWIGGGIVALIVLYLLIRHPRLGLFILWSMWGRGGGGGGGNGGFSGGGGRSGGGGARGSW